MHRNLHKNCFIAFLFALIMRQKEQRSKVSPRSKQILKKHLPLEDMDKMFAPPEKTAKCLWTKVLSSFLIYGHLIRFVAQLGIVFPKRLFFFLSS